MSNQKSNWISSQANEKKKTEKKVSFNSCLKEIERSKCHIKG